MLQGSISDVNCEMHMTEKNPRHRTRLLSTASHTYDKYAPDIAPGVQIEKEQQQG